MRNGQIPEKKDFLTYHSTDTVTGIDEVIIELKNFIEKEQNYLRYKRKIGSKFR